MVLNVKDMYGAIGNGASHPLSEVYNDLADAQARYPCALALDDQIDWCAIQTACDDASVGRVRDVFARNGVFLPSGVYRINHALWLRAPIELYGLGVNRSIIDSLTGLVTPYNLIYSPEEEDKTILETGPELFPGAGLSMRLRKDFRTRDFDIRECGTLELDGLSGFCVEFPVRITEFLGGQGVLLASAGVRLAAEAEADNAVAIALLVAVQQGAIVVFLAIDGVFHRIESAPDLVGLDTDYVIAVTYDGTTVRLFLDGDTVGEDTLPGALTQPREQHVVLGRQCAQWHGESSVNDGPNGFIGPVHFSKTTRHKRNYTPDADDFTIVDSDTLAVVAFDTLHAEGRIVPIRTYLGEAWVPVAPGPDAATTPSGLNIHDLTLHGGGIWKTHGIAGVIERVSFLSKCVGAPALLERGGEGYGFSYRNLSLQSENPGGVGVCAGIVIPMVSGVIDMSQMLISQYRYGYIIGSNIVVTEVFVDQSVSGRVGAMIRGGANNITILVSPSFGSETRAPLLETCLLIAPATAVLIIEPTFEPDGKTCITAAKPYGVRVIGGHLRGNPDYVLKVVTGRDNSMGEPVLFERFRFEGWAPTVAFSDNPPYVDERPAGASVQTVDGFYATPIREDETDTELSRSLGRYVPAQAGYVKQMRVVMGDGRTAGSATIKLFKGAVGSAGAQIGSIEVVIDDENPDGGVIHLNPGDAPYDVGEWIYAVYSSSADWEPDNTGDAYVSMRMVE